jgi:hypothetical protein
LLAVPHGASNDLLGPASLGGFFFISHYLSFI